MCDCLSRNASAIAAASNPLSSACQEGIGRFARWWWNPAGLRHPDCIQAGRDAPSQWLDAYAGAAERWAGQCGAIGGWRTCPGPGGCAGLGSEVVQQTLCFVVDRHVQATRSTGERVGSSHGGAVRAHAICGRAAHGQRGGKPATPAIQRVANHVGVVVSSSGLGDQPINLAPPQLQSLCSNPRTTLACADRG